LVKKALLSMYDVEQFLREAGAEKINEKAVISLERELEDTANQLVEEASVYANYAGRKKVINLSDIDLTQNNSKPMKRIIKYKGKAIRSRKIRKARLIIKPPKIMLVNNVPVIKEEQISTIRAQI
jgi:histone H3/H4